MKTMAEIEAQPNVQRHILAKYEMPDPLIYGMFTTNFRSHELAFIVSTTEQWDHVSVSLKNRCPNWYEMEHVAQLCFRSDEYAMQLHVPRSNHINAHPNCLHWWRPQADLIPVPAPHLVL